MRLSFFAFLAIICHLLTVSADSSSVRGGAPFDDLIDLNKYDQDDNQHKNYEAPISWDEEDPIDLTAPLQRMLLDGELDADSVFKQTLLEESHRQQQHRALNTNDEDCVENHGVDYFEIDVIIRPQNTPQNCQQADAIMLGHDINQLLWKYGVGAEGEGDQAIFLAGVCPKPTLQNRRRQLKSLEGNFVYPGVGGCRKFCNPDDYDHRRLLRENATVDLLDVEGFHDQERSLASDWFENTFKPQLEATLLSAITNEVVPLYRGCLGWYPIIEVNVEGVNRFSDLQSPCAVADSSTIGLLKTFNLADMLLNPDRSCTSCVKIDFSDRNRGEWVRYQYLQEYGVTISTYTNYKELCNTKGNAAMIFDTSIADEDVDLGSPNESCGGPGQGDGGRRGESGENCEAVGNVMIIQEGDGDPDDCYKGGTIALHFKEPVLFSDIGMMDIDEKDHLLIFTYSDGTRKTFTYKGYGDNGVQRVLCNQYDVTRVSVRFPGSGAITEFNYCPECS